MQVAGNLKKKSKSLVETKLLCRQTFSQDCRTNSNANSPASGGCHPHFKFFTCLSKQLRFHLHFWVIKHIPECWMVNILFFAHQIEKFRKLHSKIAATPKHSINKDITTIWLMWLSLFLFLCFSIKILWLIYKYWVIAQCRAQNEKYFRWVNFIICNLWNDSKV